MNMSPGDIDHLLRQERRLVNVRWAGVVLMASVAAVFTLQGTPLTPVWWVPIASFTACNLYLYGSLDSVRRQAGPVYRLLVIATAFDWLGVGFLATTWVYDDFFGSWPSLLVIPLVGAFRFGVAGGVTGWGVAVSLYLTTPVFEPDFGPVVLQPESLLYRFGLLLLLALAIGFAAREQTASRHRAEETLEQLRRSEAWRARLVATLGHDVRGPIGNVVSAAQLLQLRGAEIPDELRADTYDAIERQGSRALRLADDLLDMARMEHGAFRLERTTVDLVALAQRVVGGDRDVAIAADVDPLYGEVDAARLEQVMHNLVANARKHGKPPITITLARVADEIEIAVVDHGPGMPPDAREQLFEAFAHGGAAASTGLGLWIVTALVEAHGGTVTYREVPTGGACFVIRLPDVRPGSGA